VCELFVGGGSTSATSVLLRRRYPLTVRGYLPTLHVGGLAVAGPYPTSTVIRNYPGEPGHSLSATCYPFGSFQLGALRAIPLALCKTIKYIHLNNKGYINGYRIFGLPKLSSFLFVNKSTK